MSAVPAQETSAVNKVYLQEISNLHDMRQTIILLAVIVAVSCSSGNGKKGATNNVFEVKDICSLPMIGEISTVELDDACPISSIQKLELVDSLFYIASPEGLYCFNLKGEFKNEISCRGRADNEWVRMNTFYVDEESLEISIIDGASRKMLVYKLSGDYVTSLRLPESSPTEINDAEKTIDGSVVLSANVIGRNRTVLYSLNSDCSELNPIFDVAFRTEGVSIPTGFSPICRNRGRVKAILPFEDNVFEVERCSLKESIYIPHDSKELSKSELSRIKNYSIFCSFEYKTKGYYVGYTSIAESDSFVILSYYNNEYMIYDKIRKMYWILTPDPIVEGTKRVGSLYEVLYMDEGRIISLFRNTESYNMTLVIYTIKK